MKNRQPNRWGMDYQNRLEDHRDLSMYLQAEYFRKKNQLQTLENPGTTVRLILYGLTGIFFCIGLFFVLF